MDQRLGKLVSACLLLYNSSNNSCSINSSNNSYSINSSNNSYSINSSNNSCSYMVIVCFTCLVCYSFHALFWDHRGYSRPHFQKYVEFECIARCQKFYMAAGIKKTMNKNLQMCSRPTLTVNIHGRTATSQSKSSQTKIFRVEFPGEPPAYSRVSPPKNKTLRE